MEIPKPRRRLRRVLIALIFAATLVPACGGCTSVVLPPSDPEHPVSVFYVHESMHRGLVLPRASGGFVEYGFGEWEWYAQGANSWYRVFPALLWPSRGTLGRRHFTASNGTELREQLYWVASLVEIRVSEAAVVRLRQRLKRLYQERAGDEVFRSSFGIHFVPSDRDYWFYYNCNDAMAEWLEELGCSVSWVPVRVALKVREPG